jgi:hypothetical protein
MPSKEKVNMTEPAPHAPRLRRRFRRLAAKLGHVGWILHGTVRPRRIRAPGKTLGPYYQWTFKQTGKTVTVNLSRRQLNPWRRAINEQRKTERLLDEMRRLSRAFLEATIPGVKKRKPRP